MAGPHARRAIGAETVRKSNPKEHVVHVKGRSNQGLVVSDGGGLGDLGSTLAAKGGHGPEALVNGAEIKVDLHLVVLKSD